ncbi:hypothetical protein MASR2M15_01570 [Anaerolineales bacterium]
MMIMHPLDEAGLLQFINGAVDTGPAGFGAQFQTAGDDFLSSEGVGTLQENINHCPDDIGNGVTIFP